MATRATKAVAITRWKQVHRTDPSLPKLGDLNRRRIALVAAAFNRELTDKLVQGAIEVCVNYGLRREQVAVHWVPGSFEVPWMVQQVIKHTRPDAVVTLGTLVRGETVQYEVIAHAVTQGLMTVGLETGVPVTLGIVVASTAEQAKARCGGSAGNRGAEAARAALCLLEAAQQAS